MKIGYLMQAGVPNMRERPLSGPANHVKHIVEELRGLGHQVRLVAVQDHQIWASDDLENYRLVQTRKSDTGVRRLIERVVRRIQSTLRLPYAVWFDSMRFAEACCQELRDFDLFYERMGWVGYGGSIAAKRLGIPLVLEVNGDHLTEFELLGVAPQGMQRWLSIKMVDRMIRNVSHVVSAGDGWRERFLEQWCIEPERVTTVENGSELVTLLQRNQLRSFQNHSFASETIQIVFIGGFDPWQGLPILLNALAIALEKGSKANLTLIGSGKGENELRQLCEELGILDSVTFAGRLLPSQFAKVLANCDIAVSSYCGRVEFSGLKLLDYKAAGLAIVTSGQNGQPAIINHGETGWIVPPCDEIALSQAISYLCSNHDLRRQMGQAARIDAECRHSWRHVAVELQEIFEKEVGA